MCNTKYVYHKICRWNGTRENSAGNRHDSLSGWAQRFSWQQKLGCCSQDSHVELAKRVCKVASIAARAALGWHKRGACLLRACVRACVRVCVCVCGCPLRAFVQKHFEFLPPSTLCVHELGTWGATEGRQNWRFRLHRYVLWNCGPRKISAQQILLALLCYWYVAMSFLNLRMSVSSHRSFSLSLSLSVALFFSLASTPRSFSLLLSLSIDQFNSLSLSTTVSKRRPQIPYINNWMHTNMKMIVFITSTSSLVPWKCFYLLKSSWIRRVDMYHFKTSYPVSVFTSFPAFFNERKETLEEQQSGSCSLDFVSESSIYVFVYASYTHTCICTWSIYLLHIHIRSACTCCIYIYGHLRSAYTYTVIYGMHIRASYTYTVCMHRAFRSLQKTESRSGKSKSESESEGERERGTKKNGKKGGIDTEWKWIGRDQERGKENENKTKKRGQERMKKKQRERCN